MNYSLNNLCHYWNAGIMTTYWLLEIQKDEMCHMNCLTSIEEHMKGNTDNTKQMSSCQYFITRPGFSFLTIFISPHRVTLWKLANKDFWAEFWSWTTPEENDLLNRCRLNSFRNEVSLNPSKEEIERKGPIAGGERFWKRGRVFEMTGIKTNVDFSSFQLPWM